MNERIRLREWEQRQYKDPSDYLIRLRELEQSVIESELPDKVKALRTNKLAIHNERRQAAIFGVGMRTLIQNDTIEFASYESEDFDVIFRRVEGDELKYTPVQLKEVVSEKWNQNASLDEIVQKLRGKYSESTDAIAAVYLNRRNDGQLEVPPLAGLNLAGLYLYGCASEDQSRWWIAGDFLSPTRDEAYFEYPRRENNV